MKKLHNILSVAFLAAALCGCVYEEIPSEGTPAVVFDEETVSVYPGETVTVSGTASDPAGIRTITLRAEEWGIDREIDLSAYKPVEYVFSADVVVPESAVSGLEFEVTVASAVSGLATGSLPIVLASDSEKPVIVSGLPESVTRAIGSYTVLNLNLNVSDNKELSKVVFSGAGIDREVAVWGTQASLEESFELAQAGEFTFRVTVYDKMGNSTSASFPLTVLESDGVAPVCSPLIPEAVVVPAGSTYTLATTLSDNVAVSYCRVYVFNADWTEKIMDEYYSDFEGAASHDFSLDVQVPETPGAYNFAIWVYDHAGNWFGSESIMMVTADAPVIHPALPAALDVYPEDGVSTYTVSSIAASAKGLASYRIYLYSGDWGTCFFDDTVTAGVEGQTSAVIERRIEFPSPGTYNLAIWAYDSEGGYTGSECTVSVGGSAPVYLMLDELPSSLTLSLEGGIATHTLYMKGELTDGSLFGGVTFDLYDGDWTKIVPYGCTNTWDWSTWSMWDATSYQMEREISFDKAGIYYLYVSESLDVDGTDTWFRGHQIDITVE